MSEQTEQSEQWSKLAELVFDYSMELASNDGEEIIDEGKEKLVEQTVQICFSFFNRFLEETNLNRNELAIAFDLYEKEKFDELDDFLLEGSTE